jgi:hypothetical protein
MKPKVYIINRGCHDYTLAKQFGTLIFLTEDSFNRFSTSRMFRIFKEGLKTSTFKDYILVSGLTVMTSIACSIFAKKHGRINLLLYNSGPNKVEHYVKRTIMLEDL